MLINIMRSQEYIHGASVFDLNGRDVISSASLHDEKRYKGRFKSGGAYVRFISDAPVISVSLSNMEIESGNYPHLGITAQKGIAYSYRILGEKQWYNFDCAFGKESAWKLDIKLNICVPKGKSYEMMIYFPSLCYVIECFVNCTKGYIIKAVEKVKGNCLFIGGTNTFGIGVTSNAFTIGNIFTRKSTLQIKTIAFNYYKYLSYLNIFITSHQAEIKTSEIIFLECDGNNNPYDLLNESFSKVLSNLLQNTSAKIVLWNQPTLKNSSNEEQQKRKFVTKEIEKVESAFPDRIAFCDNYSVWDNNEFDKYAYSVNFINDFGYVWLYKRLNDILEEKKWNI